MPTNQEWADEIIQVYIDLRCQENDIVFLTYKDLAIRLGRPGQERLLAGPLDIVREECQKRQIPDVATMVVSKESLVSGEVKPSTKAASKYNDWTSLRQEQARAISFDWKTYKD